MTDAVDARARAPLSVPAHVHGLPGFALGGYVGGLLARAAGGRVEVAFHASLPVERRVTIGEHDGGWAVRDGGRVLASARAETRPLAGPEVVPTLEDAAAAAARFPPPERHPVATCFACGPLAPPGGGLRVFTGPSPDGDFVATPWVAPSTFAGRDGLMAVECVWAALDCPGGWAGMLYLGVNQGILALTASMTVDVRAPVVAGRRYVVVGWPVRRDGRKAVVGAGIFTPDGEPCALAEALWVETGMGMREAGVNVPDER